MIERTEIEKTKGLPCIRPPVPNSVFEIDDGSSVSLEDGIGHDRCPMICPARTILTLKERISA